MKYKNMRMYFGPLCILRSPAESMNIHTLYIIHEYTLNTYSLVSSPQISSLPYGLMVLKGLKKLDEGTNGSFFFAHNVSKNSLENVEFSQLRFDWSLTSHLASKA